VALALSDGAARSAARPVLLVGLGATGKITADSLRQAAGALAKALRRHRINAAALLLPAELPGIDAAAAAEALATGLLLASFKYREYKGAVARKKKSEEEDDAKALRITLVAGGQARSLQQALDRARAIADGQNFARTIAWRPGNDINPPALAKVAEQLANETGLDCRILDEKQMARLGMGGILGVGAGSSATPPRMIILQYRPGGIKAARARARAGKADRPLLVVGKAITFDTGGISIKPAEKMGKMIFDKCGGMAVLGLMYAVAKLKPGLPVVGILSSAENHISQTAYRPGDVLRMYNGVTVEVTNTDAEGRLVLGDALAWGIETYKPTAVIDLATLTGGVVVALGRTMAGLMSNNDDLVAEIQQAADRAGEKLWRLPLGDDQREQIKSEPADIVNSAGRDAHPLQGGAFLSHFIPDNTPWCHLDIAGVADTDKELPYYAKGATGWGVRTLVEWVTARDSA
jgi:leucyl aminopeptidase